MIWNQVELHNVAEVLPERGGARLLRVPQTVRQQLSETGKMRMAQTDNCEIRFVCEDGPVDVTVSSENQTYVAVFQGGFDCFTRVKVGREPVTIKVNPWPKPLQVDPAALAEKAFQPHVMRLVCGGRSRSSLVIHDIRGNGFRPPTASEVPALRYLAYGTSITQGFDSEAAHLNYVSQAAWHLRADVINLGSGGSCFCEAAMADYIAQRRDWNVATLELSVNMTGFEPEVYSERLRYMVHTVAGADASRHVFCLTLFPHGRDFGVSTGDGVKASHEVYRQILRDVVRECASANVHLIEGPELLQRVDGLRADLLHPSDHAMIEIGWRLATSIQKVIEMCPTAIRKRMVAGVHV